MSSPPSPPTHAEIQSLLSTSAYNPAIIPQLESYVRAQLSTVASSLVASQSPAQYSFEANRTLIKLYQFFPHLLTASGGGEGVACLVGFLALLSWPETEFVALGCLIPERVQSVEPFATLVRYSRLLSLSWNCLFSQININVVKTIMAMLLTKTSLSLPLSHKQTTHQSCNELLESCRFSSFWPEFRKLGIPEYGAPEGQTSVSDDRKLLADAVNGSRASHQIRVSMIRMLAKTYKSAPLSYVLSALDLKDEASLMSFASKVMFVTSGGGGSENEMPIVEKVEGGFVTFVSSAENTKRVGSAYKEGVNYQAVAAMMSKSKIRGQ
ncbi:hypothetical protein HJC23_008835 [Cyclotella cryptica]|uniref:CSN8/PSMD8/EIF3K domain-containing protein n=1 Tax=Cyclotella cryptica TaxID=29204 RepID=A0ABD3Q9Z6_9STRA